MKIWLQCENCGTVFPITPKRIKGNRRARFCSKECRVAARQHIKRTVMHDGYVRLTGAGLNISEHRYVMEQHLGRPLAPDEHIHHINGDKQDNRRENLMLITLSEHIHKYHPRQAKMEKQHRLVCAYCGVTFFRRKTETRTPEKSYHNRRCYRLAMQERRNAKTQSKTQSSTETGAASAGG